MELTELWNKFVRGLFILPKFNQSPLNLILIISIVFANDIIV